MKKKMTEVQIRDKARIAANRSQFKSNYPYDHKSYEDGYFEAMTEAMCLFDVSGQSEQLARKSCDHACSPPMTQAIISLCMIADLSKRQEFDMCIADLPEDIRTEARHIFYSRLSKATIIHDILRIVAEESGIPADVITSRKRQFYISDARKVVIKLCVKYSDQSYSTIGKFVGRDHATVCQQLKRHDELTQVSVGYSTFFKRCEERLNALSGNI